VNSKSKSSSSQRKTTTTTKASSTKEPSAKASTKKASTKKTSSAKTSSTKASSAKTSTKSRSSGSSTTRTSKPRTSRSSTSRSSTSRSSTSRAATQRSTSSTTAPAKQGSATEVGSTDRQWYKADLHLHTMASNDYEQPDATYLEWMRRVAEQELDIVAVTDHNTVAGIGAIREEIEWLTRLEEKGRLKKDEKEQLAEWRELSEKVLLLPGFEFTATFGFHILGIFPPETPTRQLELLLLQLGVPSEKLDEGSTETGATTDVREAYRIIQEAGGLVIAAHANSTHGVAMRDFPFGGQTKIAYTQDPNLDALEVTDLEKRSRSTARFFNGTKAEYPRRMHCIQGSDAHCVVTQLRMHVMKDRV